MNLLQFLIFMQQWQTSLPYTTSIFLRELKNIALYEFIPMESIKSWIRDLFGIEDNCSGGCHTASSEEDTLNFDSGIDRVGSNSLIDNMGAMLGLGIVIILLLIVLGLLLLCVKRSPRAKRIYTALSKKLFYNTFMRYVLQSSLKLQIAACTVLFYSQLHSGGVNEPAT